jgi:hypothetical protein
MARKVEAGIEYFPMNADIIHNPKIKLVVAEFGSRTTWAVLLPLYCKIYREKGYWIDWADEDSKMLFAQDDCKLELSTVNEVVQGCIRRSLFDKGVFDVFGVLTSDRIQSNYYEATARRKKVEFVEEFMVKNNDVNVKRDNVNIIPLNVDILTKKVNISTQKKKEKENEKKKENGDELTHTQEQVSLFKNFQVWLNSNAPRINQLKQPLTLSEYLSLREDLSKETLKTVCISMQNRADLLKKYVSANLTIRNWAKREMNDKTPEPGIVRKINDDKARAILNS